MNGFRFVPFLFAAALFGAVLSPASAAERIYCAGDDWPSHLQGVATDGMFLYWSHTTVLAKTDRTGKVLVKSGAVPSHHGDLCVKDGVVYVAVNRGRFNAEKGADSWVYAYKAEDLSFLRKWAVPELVHGAGGMTWKGDRFYLVGGLPATHDCNYVYEYTKDFAFVKRHVLASGWTNLGIQTVDYSDGKFRFGCYGGTRKSDGKRVPSWTLVTPDGFAPVSFVDENVSEGVLRFEGRIWKARIQCTNAGAVKAAANAIAAEKAKGVKKPSVRPVARLFRAWIEPADQK